METLGKRLKRLRSDKDMSAQQVADLAGIPVTTYREWENGRQILGEPYEKLAHALDVTLFELLTGRKPNRADLFIKLEEVEMALGELRSHLGSLLT
ncbi:helix-turn-helix domain-containing protein [Bdellovibrio sp. SKB1291214]|uniref:helix-turn-helix domain-containing protein n=1 Tax=Bdellovibrio sp. SKB1291214 TaxID=1732569 RepID=UPI00159591CD|nr:helix-turn-helix transcriptional regulator [Bdellovibrio sp. SKB1291214]UYL07515.1 helix-turn-helix domain-containing protein [Bdellovibrio sp. SKB1291214]